MKLHNCVPGQKWQKIYKNKGSVKMCCIWYHASMHRKTEQRRI